MVRTEDERHPHVDHRVAGEHAALQRVLDAGVDRRDVLLRDHAAGDLVDELVAAAGAGGLEVDDDVAVLALAARLADVLHVHLLDGLGDRLAVGDLRLAGGGVDLELAEHPVDEHLEVELALAADDRLAGLVVGVDLERRVLVRQRGEGLAQLVLGVLRLRLDRDLDDGLGEVERLEDDRRLVVAEGVAGRRLLEADDGDDVTGVGDVAVLAVCWRASGGCGRCAPCGPSSSSRHRHPSRACPSRCGCR